MSAFDLISQRIRERGPITVAEYMSMALYHPECGYYAQAVRRTGRNGDFITSVDIGPLFGTLLSRQLAEMWLRMRESEDEAFDVVEAGASNGQLARDVLDAAAANDPAFYRAIRLHLVEASPAARATHPQVLGPHAVKLASSSARLPDVVHGAIYANELFDALPVHAVVMSDEGLRECYVDLHGDRLVERVGPLSNAALARYFEALDVTLEPGWRAEVNLAALAWMTRASLSLHRGFMLLVDYGHEARELYSATHATGTLTTFTRHVSERTRGGGTPPWLVDPGGRDVTSHIDLTSIRRTAEALGCTTLGLLDQTYFLLALGLAAEVEGAPSTAATRRRLMLKTLMLPGGLGSTHKVMIFSKDLEQPVLRGLSGTLRLT